MSHILIVGGTGMLRDVVLYYTKHNQTVSVIGREQRKFDSLLKNKGEYGIISQLRLDYSNTERLESKLLETISDNGPVETAICWIHSTSPDAPSVIARVLNDKCENVKYFHILGSSYKNPSKVPDNFENRFKDFSRIRYRKIILGFTKDENGSRWLTDAEISNGVIDAVNSDAEEYIIGKIEPWSEHP